MRKVALILAMAYVLFGTAFALYPKRVEAKKKIIFASGIAVNKNLCRCPNRAASCYCAFLVDDGSSSQ